MLINIYRNIKYTHLSHADKPKSISILISHLKDNVTVSAVLIIHIKAKYSHLYATTGAAVQQNA